jgi:FAD/FMN-containing dehydrogenase
VRRPAALSTGSVRELPGVGDEPERVREAYGANYDRLARIKQKYDPGNLFRANQNIKPRG